MRSWCSPVNTSPCHGEDRGFKSLRPRTSKKQTKYMQQNISTKDFSLFSILFVFGMRLVGSYFLMTFFILYGALLLLDFIALFFVFFGVYLFEVFLNFLLLVFNTLSLIPGVYFPEVISTTTGEGMSEVGTSFAVLGFYFFILRTAFDYWRKRFLPTKSAFLEKIAKIFKFVVIYKPALFAFVLLLGVFIHGFQDQMLIKGWSGFFAIIFTYSVAYYATLVFCLFSRLFFLNNIKEKD